MIQLIFYYPHPDPPGDALVTIDPYPEMVFGDTWDLARVRKPSLVDHIGSARCTFFIPSNLSLLPYDTLLSRSRDWLLQHRDNGKTARSFYRLSDVFPPVPPPVSESVHVDVLVVTDELLEGLDDLRDPNSQALKQRAKGIKSFRISFPTPLTGVSSFAGVMDIVDRARNKFHSGRPAGNFGPPVSLFNRALGLFDYHLSHLDDEPSTVDLPPSLIQQAHIFMVIAADSYSDESIRTVAIKDILNNIFGMPFNWDVSQDQFGIKTDAIGSSDTPFFVVEVKNEAGLEGDASLQAALSYAHIATSTSNHTAVFSNYPAVLYGIMGNLLQIGVAMYTDGVHSNLLFSEWLHLGFYTERNLLRLARAFAATRQVIADLREFYMTPLPAPGSIAHLFPSPLQVPTCTDSLPSLTFTGRLSRSGETVVLAEDEITRQSGLYLATMTRPLSADEDTVVSSSVEALAGRSKVVVKFTAQYHPEAHRLLANEGLAPVLHACIPVCSGLFMVVMDHVDGETAWHAVRRGELLPYDIYKDIKDAVERLHSKNLVFGDLRSPNIMVVPGGSGSDARRRGMLIDFDWVGAHGIGRYPASLDDGLPDWILSGIRRYGIMYKAHDLIMLNKFKERCHPV